MGWLGRCLDLLELRGSEVTRRAARVDANHAEIVGCFRACGCDVQSLAAVGCGVPDLLVHQRSTGKLWLVEVKDGRKPPSQRGLTVAQVEFHAIWPVHVVMRVEDVPVLLAGRPKEVA